MISVKQHCFALLFNGRNVAKELLFGDIHQNVDTDVFFRIKNTSLNSFIIQIDGYLVKLSSIEVEICL